jgi:hypothetical protein
MEAISIPISAQRVAQELHMPLDGLLQRSVRAFLLQESRAAHLDIADFQDRYGTTSAKMLLTQIEQGTIYSHPAWEDSIEWQRIENYLDHVNHLLGEVQDVR